MPTNIDDGVVISLDIVNSTKIRHIHVKDFFEDALKQCISLLHERYDPELMTANGYRVKELGDGFICSIGYPFSTPNNENPAELAVQLALKFIEKVEKAVSQYNIKHDVYCGIGIALGSLHGFYPSIGTREYDLFGRGIILSNRYEAMRKKLLVEQKTHSIILQSSVYNSLSEEYLSIFDRYELDESVVVRDDPEARDLYCSLISFGGLSKEGA